MKRDKNLFIIAGCNGSGKTTLAKNMLENDDSLYFLNADEIGMALYPGQKINRVDAGKKFLEELKNSIDKDLSPIVETTLSGRYLLNYIEIFKKNNYTITLIYLFISSPLVAIGRVTNRVAMGGHMVPREDIERRYKRGIIKFWDSYKDTVDNWIVYSNDENEFKPIVYGDKAHSLISDKDLLNKFRQICDEVRK